MSKLTAYNGNLSSQLVVEMPYRVQDPPLRKIFLKYTYKCACKYVKIPIFTKMKPGGELVYV